MPRNNHVRRFRPLRAGTRVINGVCMNPGTIGFVGADREGGLWIVSCRHVLIRPKGWTDEPFAEGEAVYQPNRREADNIVARTVSGHADARLDCAAVPVLDGIEVSPEILGLAVPGPPKAARRGMAVVKSGMRTGVTEGIVHRISGPTIEIRPPRGFPDDYQLCDPGDSGALWLEKDTLAPVALHRAGGTRGAEFARARPIRDVLQTLGLEIVQG